MDTVQSEEELAQERIRCMKETIEDIQLRMTAKDESDSDEVLVTDSTSSPRTM